MRKQRIYAFFLCIVLLSQSFFGTFHTTYANPNLDSDGDGIIDSIDLDDDNDGILDTDEGFIGTALDFTGITPIVAPSQSGPWTVAPKDFASGGTSLAYNTTITLTGRFLNSPVPRPPNGNGAPMGKNNGDILIGIDANGSLVPVDVTKDYMMIEATFSRPVLVNIGPRINIPTNFDSPDYWQIEATGGLKLASNGPRTTSGSITTVSTTTIGNWTASGDVATFSPTTPSATQRADDNYSFLIQTNKLVNKIRLKMSTLSASINSSPINISVQIPTDTDGDGTPNYLDVDSDNDGCPDALE